MKPDKPKEASSRLIILLVLLLPPVLLFLLPSGSMMGVIWFWLLLLISFWLVWMVIGSPRAENPGLLESVPRMLHENEQPEAVREAMDVRIATEEGGVQVFRGELREPPASVFERLRNAFGDSRVPLLQQDERLGSAIILMPKQIEEETMKRPVRPWLHWLLFVLTILTTTWAGAAHQGINLFQAPERFVEGLPYSLGLLAILGVHELGHYFMARHHRMNVTPPFFIPVPFALGTFGAFIQMRSPAENRRILFDVAVAGPLAGFVVAVPALLVGLQSSAIVFSGVDPAGAGHHLGGTSVGSSLLFAVLAKFAFGEALQAGHLVQLSPLAFAGWLGLFITALNLVPVGQLDGGHTVRALFGQRIGGAISSVAMWTLFLLAIFVWPGLMMWALIVFFIAGRSAPPLDDLTPLTPGRRWIGYLTFAILAVIIVPLPHAFWDAAGFHCPYL